MDAVQIVGELIGHRDPKVSEIVDRSEGRDERSNML